MRKMLIIAFLTATIGAPFAAFADNGTACASFMNATGPELKITTHGKQYTVAPGKWSQVFNQPDGALYNLLQGQIKVSLGAPQITQDGNFSMKAGNHDIPPGESCTVYYKIRIYKG